MVHNLTWAQVNLKYREKAPHALDLVDLILSLPASSAICERGFSLMKLIKTDYRNKLRCDTMTQLIRIKLHSQSIEEFDPSPAIHHWNQTGHRRPAFKQNKRQKLEEATELSEAVLDGNIQQEAEAEAESSKNDLNGDPNDSDHDSLLSDDGNISFSDDNDNDDELFFAADNA